tara:strand:- start:760 stop:990 length:231 start_codon:yes stop_codon:yes gene_type:complete
MLEVMHHGEERITFDGPIKKGVVGKPLLSLGSILDKDTSGKGPHRVAVEKETLDQLRKNPVFIAKEQAGTISVHGA